MRFVPGPDLPTDGRSSARHPRGLRDGARHVPHTGHGRFRTSPRARGIVVRAAAGRRPERVKEDRRAGPPRRCRASPPSTTTPTGRGLRLVIEVKNGSTRRHPRAALSAHAARGHVRHQQRGSRRRAATHDGPQELLRSTSVTGLTSYDAARLPPEQPRPASISSTACSSRSSTSMSDRHDPVERRPLARTG